MNEFDDADISALLDQMAGPRPDVITAQRAVLTRVRRVRQRRAATVGAAALVMIVSGAVAVVQTSKPNTGPSNIAIAVSPDDSLTVDTTAIGDPAKTTGSDPANSVNLPTNSENSLANTTIPTGVATPSTATPSSTPSSMPIPDSTSAPKISTTTRPPAPTFPPSAPETSVPTTTPFVPQTRTWSCAGGSVTYVITDNGIELVTTTPARDFKSVQSKAEGREIMVVFKPVNGNDNLRSVIKIKRTTITSTSCEDDNFDRRSDRAMSDPKDNNVEDDLD